MKLVWPVYFSRGQDPVSIRIELLKSLQHLTIEVSGWFLRMEKRASQDHASTTKDNHPLQSD
jgi:hypothetical protein